MKKNFIIYHLLVLGIVTLAGVFVMLSQPASPQNQVVFSFSLPQIIFCLVWLALAGICFYYAWLIHKSGSKSLEKFFMHLENTRRSRIIALGAAQLLLLALAAFTFGADPFFGRLSGYLVRVKPFIGWFALVSVQILVFLVQLEPKNRQGHRPLYQPRLTLFLVILAIFCMLWAGISFTGFGVGTNDDHVRTPTIFITYNEFFFALLITCQVWITSQFSKYMLSDEQLQNLRVVSPLLIGLAIWGLTFLIWINEPMRNSYNWIGPFPNGDFIPASDSTRFDLPGQLALIGEGLNSGNYIDNPFYVFMVMLFRLAGGQFYPRMIVYQVAVLAFIPVGLFSLGNMFANQYLGILLAILTIIREKNILRYSSDTWLSPIKALLTEPFITLILVGFCLYLVKWLRDDGPSPAHLVLAGGLFGLSTLVRTNPWFILPVSVAVIILKMRFGLRKAALFSVIFGAAVFASIFPWMLRSQATISTPFYFLFKMQHSVVDERYGNLEPKENEPGQQVDVPTPEDAGLVISEEIIQPEVEPSLAPSSEDLAEPSLTDQEPVFEIPTPTLQPVAIEEAVPPEIYVEGSGNNGLPEEAPPPDINDVNSPGSPRLATIIAEHFVFNLVNTVQILPTLLPNSTPGMPLIFPTSVFIESKHAGIEGSLSVLFILICLSAGISFNQQMPFLAGIFPLIYYLTYGAGTAIALTSASRYTQPVEWVILLYFSAGLFYIVRWFMNPFTGFLSKVEPAEAHQPVQPEVTGEKIRPVIKAAAPWIVLFLMIGSFIPLSGVIFPKIYSVQTKEELTGELDIQRLAQTAGMTVDDYSAYINQSETNIIEGRLVYAQYYRAGEGEDMSRMREVVYDYPRITFELLGPYKPTMNVLLPYEEPWPDAYLSGRTAIVIGCPSGGGMDAMSIFLPELDLYLSRTPTIQQRCR